MIKIHHYDPAKTEPAHNGTVLGMHAFDPGMNEPFSHLITHLETNGVMDGSREGHSHPTGEIYVMLEGEGIVIVDGEEAPVRVGDVIEIPRNAAHTMENKSGRPLTWLAIWWD